MSHEHHDRLWQYVDQLDTLAGCMDCECLDTARLTALQPELREAHEGLTDLLIPHMEAVEAAVYPTLDRLLADRGATVSMSVEHIEIRRLVQAMADFVARPEAHTGRGAVLALRRVLLRLHALLEAHLAEEELYIPILEDRLTPAEEGALARALDHVAAERL